MNDRDQSELTGASRHGDILAASRPHVRIPHSKKESGNAVSAAEPTALTADHQPNGSYARTQTGDIPVALLCDLLTSRRPRMRLLPLNAMDDLTDQVAGWLPLLFRKLRVG